jgi:hypothetical protein
LKTPLWIRHRPYELLLLLDKHLYPHSSGYDYEAELYQPLKASVLANTHRFFLPHELENIDVDATDQLKQTDVLIAEASLPSTGQGMELGQPNMAAVPTICFYKNGTSLSSALRFVTKNFLEYKNTQDFLAKPQAALDQLSVRNK